MQRIPLDEGYGCCSDHTQAFLALTSLVGIDAREMRHQTQFFAEVFAPELGHWVWVDPQYAVLARGNSGQYLSFLELRDHYLHDDISSQPVEFEFIGNRYHEFSNKSPYRSPYYDGRSDLLHYESTWGNNVFSQDNFEQSLSSIPKLARQVLGYMTGALPEHVMLINAENDLPEQLRRHRIWCLGTLSFLFALHAGVLSYAMRCFRRT